MKIQFHPSEWTTLSSVISLAGQSDLHFDLQFWTVLGAFPISNESHKFEMKFHIWILYQYFAALMWNNPSSTDGYSGYHNKILAHRPAANS